MKPLRLALLVDQFPELSETFIAGEAQSLKRAGHHVRVEATARPEVPNADAAAGLEVRYLEDDSLRSRLRDLVWLVAHRPSACARDLVARWRWRRYERVEPLKALAPVARRVRSAGERHLHAHFAGEAALRAMRIGRLLGLPYSLATHGYDLFQLPRNIREKHEKAAFAVSACHYSVDHVRRMLAPVHAARVRRLVVGVDGSVFHRRLAYPGDRTVIAVARLVEKKGLRHLLDAVALLERDEPPLRRLQIVGDGPLRRELVDHGRRLGLANKLEWLGTRRPSEVKELLEGADLLAMPCVVASDGDRDTMPVCVKEALAMEVPVVASDEVGLPEVVRPEWGRLVPPGDAQALAHAIAELLALPPEERARMGRAGREFVLRECDIHRGAEELARLIADAE